MITDFKNKYKYPIEIETYSHELCEQLQDFFVEEEVEPDIFYKLLCNKK